jgi:hypothetical protein
MFDSLKDVITWLGNLLKDIVTGIQGTFHYWDRTAKEIEELA